MPTRIIRHPEHIDILASILLCRKLPLTVTWSQGAPRTDAQNNLSFQWYVDAARQLGDCDHGDTRALSKVLFAAPILCRDNPAFCVSWEKLRARFSHEEIVQFVKDTELPMTSIMKLKQMIEYMDAIERYWRDQGVRLTDPESMKYEREFA